MFQSKENYIQLKRIRTLKLNLNPNNNYNKQRVRNILLFVIIKNNRVLLQ